MRKIERTSSLEPFKRKMDDREFAVEVGFFVHLRHWFSPFSFFVVVLVGSLLGSMGSRALLVVFFATLAMGVYFFFEVGSKAKSLHLRRRGLAKVQYQGEKVKIGIEFHNSSLASFDSEVIVEDFVSASRNSHVTLSRFVHVPGMGRTVVEYERICDAEMGEHWAGPIRVRIKDQLGLFEISVLEDDLTKFEVLPRIKNIRELAVQGSIGSPHYGQYEVPVRGLSVNFVGIRPFVYGDSLRHIAWKIYGKHQELMVKEFEKVVDCDIAIIANLEPHIHAGLESGSTWDLAKHAALSIARQQLESGNSIQLYTDGYTLPITRGSDCVDILARQLARIKPNEAIPGEKRVVDQIVEQLAYGSTAVYITVYDKREIEKDYRTLVKMMDRKMDIFVVLIDATSLLLASDSPSQYLSYIVSRAIADLEQEAVRLRTAGCQVAILRNDGKLVFNPPVSQMGAAS